MFVSMIPWGLQKKNAIKKDLICVGGMRFSQGTEIESLS